MSRISPADRIEVRPANNVYTVLVAVSVVIEIIAFVALFMRHQQLFGVSLFS